MNQQRRQVATGCGTSLSRKSLCVSLPAIFTARSTVIARTDAPFIW
jgi:hypothetical protein